jgi:hypothetical protein
MRRLSPLNLFAAPFHSWAGRRELPRRCSPTAALLDLEWAPPGGDHCPSASLPRRRTFPAQAPPSNSATATPPVSSCRARVRRPAGLASSARDRRSSSATLASGVPDRQNSSAALLRPAKLARDGAPAADGARQQRPRPAKLVLYGGATTGLGVLARKRKGRGCCTASSLFEKKVYGWPTFLLYATQTAKWISGLGLHCWRQSQLPRKSPVAALLCPAGHNSPPKIRVDKITRVTPQVFN